MANIDEAVNDSLMARFLETGKSIGLPRLGQHSMLDLFNGVLDFSRAGKTKTSWHVMRVAVLSARLANYFGLPSEFQKEMYVLGAKHDDGHKYDSESLACLEKPGYSKEKDGPITKKHVELNRVVQNWGETIKLAAARHHAHQENGLGPYSPIEVQSSLVEFYALCNAALDCLDAAYTRKDHTGNFLSREEAMAYALKEYRDKRFKLDSPIQIDLSGQDLFRNLTDAGVLAVTPCTYAGLSIKEKNLFSRLNPFGV